MIQDKIEVVLGILVGLTYLGFALFLAGHGDPLAFVVALVFGGFAHSLIQEHDA